MRTRTRIGNDTFAERTRVASGILQRCRIKNSTVCQSCQSLHGHLKINCLDMRDLTS